jgi:hypothetical protein
VGTNETDDAAYIQELIDREKIRDCLARYSTGIDRCDPEMLMSSYWPDAHDEHGDFNGTAEEFVEWVIPQLRRLVCTQHFMGHSLIRIDGNTARVQTYTQNWHTVRNFNGRSHDLIHGGRYLDKFEKRGTEWRVSDRLVMHDWILEQPTTVDISRQNPGLLGQDQVALSARKPDDALYTFLGGLPTGGYLGVPAKAVTAEK